MPNIRSLSRRSLLAASAWSHRGAVGSWIGGITVVMVVFAYGYRGMVQDFVGGPQGFGAAAQAAADAMRPLDGPAYRLDTFAGYATYHNLGWWSLLLAVYAAIQGARAVRGLEESGALQLYLATGTSRTRIVLERAGGFAIALVAITIGTGIGTALGTVAAGEPAWAGAMVVALEMSLTGAVFYALALALAQLTKTARAAAGAAALVAVVTFVVSNLSDQLGGASWLGYLSPFYYLLQSKFAMVPGHTADPIATVVLLAATVPFVAAAVLGFRRRDLNAVLLPLRVGAPRRRSVFRERRTAFRSLWTSFLREQWLGLFAWFAGAAVLQAVYLWIYPQIRDVWVDSEIVKVLVARSGGTTLLDSYLSLTLGFIAIISAAFSVVQAGRWIGDRSDRRDEMYLAGMPVSRTRLNLERWLALAIGLMVVSAGSILGLVAGAASAHLTLNADGLVRTGADVVLIGLAVGGLSAVLASWLRSGLALGVLAAVLAASYLLTVLQPLFKWPDWTAHVSVFDAFGFPYTLVPSVTGIAVLTALAVAGAAIAITITARRSSI